jgi:phosphohistidine phosphatase
MPKTIVFMRHGKAADISDYNTDFERPLVSRGKEEAALAADKLKIIGIVPNSIVASPAQRTQDTAQAVCKALGLKSTDYSTAEVLYGGSFFDYLEVAGKTKGNVILLIGHNPEIGRLAMHFSKAEITSFPTSACAAFRFQSDDPGKNDIAEMLFYDLRK